MVNPKECKVALLAGGSSGEREISIASGKGAKEALETAGFQVTQIDPSNKNDLRKLIEDEFDVAFLCLHGKMGEDGTVQGFLETLKIPYTCSGVQASANAIDKIKSKILYRNSNIPTANSVILNSYTSVTTREIVDTIGLPCVIKPATEGSALGVEIVSDENSIQEAIERVRKIDTSILIEQFIDGIEITVAVLGNDDPYALPVIEIIPTGEFYDFESKYAPGGSKHICPARLKDTETELAKEYAIKAHKALGCSGVSRSDFIVDKDSKPWILETNTIPGMTSTSLLPDAARAANISFPELCKRLIEYALER